MAGLVFCRWPICPVSRSDKGSGTFNHLIRFIVERHGRIRARPGIISLYLHDLVVFLQSAGIEEAMFHGKGPHDNMAAVIDPRDGHWRNKWVVKGDSRSTLPLPWQITYNPLSPALPSYISSGQLPRSTNGEARLHCHCVLT